MTTFPDGVVTKSDAILFLKIVGGQEQGALGEWGIDDFMSVPHPEPVIERCRKRFRDELADMLSCTDPAVRTKFSEIVDDMVKDLEGSAG